MNQSNKEKGVVIVLFALFLTVVLPLFAYAVDGYFLLQSRLDQQNTGEYLSLAALSGFYDSEAESDFTVRRQEAIDAISEIANENSIIGLGGASTSWEFTTANCDNATCQGTGWVLKFGFWNDLDSTFTLSQPIFEEVADSIQPDSVNAILLELQTGSGESLTKFFSKSSENNPGIKISSIAYSYTAGINRRFKLIKNNAGGNAL